MKKNCRKIGAVILSLALLFAGCSKDETSQSEVAEEPVYPFINTLEEPADNVVETVEAPTFGEDIAKMHDTVNTDIVGWLQVPGTDIDQPVVQTTNNSTYMRLSYDGTYNFQGCYWVDYECNVGDRVDESRNTIIFGHNTAVVEDDPDGLDFAQLLRFTDKEFAMEHPYIFFSTSEDDMVWEIFAVLYTDLGFDYINMIDGRISELVSEGQSRSVFDYEVEVDPLGDKFLTLSTCTAKYGYAGGDARARFVVMARLVEEGRQLKTTVGVKDNEDVKNPQL